MSFISPKFRLIFGLSVLLLLSRVPSAIAVDPLALTVDPETIYPGMTVTFTFSPAVFNPNDIVNFTFGDGGKDKVAYASGCGLIGGCNTITHVYAGPGNFTVVATGKISNVDVAGQIKIVVQTSLDDSDIYIPTAAHSGGYLGADWRTDVEVYNPSETSVEFDIALLLSESSNTDPKKVTYTLSPTMCAHYSDIIGNAFKVTGSAALRITPKGGPLIVTSRTYNQLANGTYGQLVPAIVRVKALNSSQIGAIIGLSHNPAISAGTGFRTNIGFVNASPAPIVVEVSYWRLDGSYLGRKTYDLKAYEFRQQNRAFEGVTKTPVENAFVTVRTLTSGAKYFAYAAVVDNATNDPVYLPANVIE